MWHHVRITYNIQAPLEVLPLFVACYLDLWHLGLFRDILHVKCSSGQALAWLLWLQCHSCCGSCASFERLLWSQMITQDKSHGCVAKAMTADEERNKGISLCNFARWFIYDSTVLITCWWRLSVIRVMVNLSAVSQAFGLATSETSPVDCDTALINAYDRRASF